MSESEKCIVECPFCNTEVTLEYDGGMTIGPGGPLGCAPVSEGTCSSCGAHISAEPTMKKDGTSELQVYGYKYPEAKEGMGEPGILLIFAPNEVKSYTMREGVRV